MAKSKTPLDKNISEIRKLLESGKLILGTEQTINKLRNNQIGKVYLSANCPQRVKEDISSIAQQAEIIELHQSNEELGVLCKKSFSISVIGVSA
jgi:ribosomal protein L30E